MAKAKKKSPVSSKALEKSIAGATGSISTACAAGVAAIAAKTKDSKKLLAEGKSLGKKKAVLAKRLKTANDKVKKNPSADAKKALKAVEKDLAAITKQLEKSVAEKAANAEEMAELRVYVKRMKAYLSAVRTIDKDTPKPVKKAKKVVKKTAAKKKKAAKKKAAKKKVAAKKKGSTKKKVAAKKKVTTAKKSTVKSSGKAKAASKPAKPATKSATKPKPASKPKPAAVAKPKSEAKAAPVPPPAPKPELEEEFGTQAELDELKDLMSATETDENDIPELTSAVPMSDDITDDYDVGGSGGGYDDDNDRPW